MKIIHVVLYRITSTPLYSSLSYLYFLYNYTIKFFLYLECLMCVKILCMFMCSTFTLFETGSLLFTISLICSPASRNFPFSVSHLIVGSLKLQMCAAMSGLFRFLEWKLRCSSLYYKWSCPSNHVPVQEYHILYTAWEICSSLYIFFFI